MDEPFELPVIYKEQELMFPAQLILSGYTHKIQVDVYGEEVLFEPDEERNYRALVDTITLEKGKKLDIELLKAIASAIEAIVK